MVQAFTSAAFEAATDKAGSVIAKKDVRSAAIVMRSAVTGTIIVETGAMIVARSAANIAVNFGGWGDADWDHHHVETTGTGMVAVALRDTDRMDRVSLPG